jgi:hypothetical protein
MRCGRILEDQGLIVIANRGMQRGAEMHDNHQPRVHHHG